MTGTITKVEWANPHARFYIDVKDENGKVNNWDFELASPNGLMRRGWTRNSLKIGDVVTVTGWAAKNSPYVGNTSTVTLSDGRKVFAGSSAETETNP
jgi:outer membrane usher protein FimD/PapC